MVETRTVKKMLEAGILISFEQIFVPWRYSRAKLVRETGMNAKRLSILIHLPHVMTREECKVIAAHFQVTQKLIKTLAKCSTRP